MPCDACGLPAHATIWHPGDISRAYCQGGGRSSHGVYISCPTCHYEDITPLSHLTLDTPEVRQFWRKHPRMLWLPEREIEYAGQSALLSSFQSKINSARFDVVFQHETLQVLGTHEETR